MLDFNIINPERTKLGRDLIARIDNVPKPFAVKSSRWDDEREFHPEDDVSRPAAYFYGLLNLDNGRLSGCANYFPAGGGMGWHTDSHREGWRIYVRRLDGGNAVFKYNDFAISEWPGIGGYVFRVGADCWHSIRTNGDRFSCGIRLTEAEALAIVNEVG